MFANTLNLQLQEFHRGHNLSQLAMIFLSAVLCYAIMRLVYISFFSSLRHIPGPFLAKLTRFWEIRKVFTGNIHKVMINLHKTHGPIVQVGPNRYDFDTPDAVKTIYRIGNAFPKSHYYDPFGSTKFKNLLNELDNRLHAVMRKQIASLYTMSALLAYEKSVDAQTSILKDKLQTFCSQVESIDLPQFLQFYAFDVIGAISLGQSMGMMEANADIHGACRGLDSIWHYTALMGLMPGLHPWVLRISSLLRRTLVTDGLDKFVESKMHEYMEERKSHGSETETGATFMSQLLKLQQQGKVSDEEIRLCIFMNIGAGSDTTAISLSSIIYYLYTNPDTLHQLRTELDVAAQKGTVSDPIKFTEAQQMPYLQAVIKESLRLHPGVGTQLTRVVPKGGIVIENQYFHEGAEVGVNGWALYHNQNAFGKDASEFRPDRWLESENDDLKISGSFAFGAGPRSCIGKNISILEMSKAIPRIVQNFDIEIEKGDWKSECWWFVKPFYKARVKRRVV